MVLSGRDAGFSLVELMVVLAIAGLAASAVVLSFSRGMGWPGRRGSVWPRVWARRVMRR
jgi:prepilin-type N-terminal cleavage/methylation domain-containing protein